jgi:hypothetical protein
MDCVSEDEYTPCPDGGLVGLFLSRGFGEGLFLFYGDIAKLCRIKDFSAFLTLNKLCVFLAGDDLDDGMFALGGHWGRKLRMVWILPVSGELVNCDFSGFCGESWWTSCGRFVVEWLVKRGCKRRILDVHYLGLELSDIRRFSGGREP